METYTIAQVLASSSPLVPELNSEASQKRLKQLHVMLDYGLNHLTSAPFLEVFGTYDIDKLTQAEFNKAITEYKRPAPPTANRFTTLTKLSLLPPDMLRRELKQDRETISEAIKRSKDSIEDWRNNARYHQDEIRKHKNDLSHSLINEIREQASIESLTKRLELPDTIDTEKLRILKEIPDSWIVVKVTKKYFCIVRRNPIIMNATNAGSGLARSLNMGFIGMRYAWNGLAFEQAVPIADFPLVSRINTSPNAGLMGTIHPHLQHHFICYGNTAHRAEDLQKAGRAKEYFELLESVLTTYCPDNPFVTMDLCESKGRSVFNRELVNNSDWSFLAASEMRNTLFEEWAPHASPLFQEKYRQERFKNPSDTISFFTKYREWVKYAHISGALSRLNDKLRAIGAARGQPLFDLLVEHGYTPPHRLQLYKASELGFIDEGFISLLLAIYGYVELDPFEGVRRCIRWNESCNMDGYVHYIDSISSDGKVTGYVTTNQDGRSTWHQFSRFSGVNSRQYSDKVFIPDSSIPMTKLQSYPVPPEQRIPLPQEKFLNGGAPNGALPSGRHPLKRDSNNRWRRSDGKFASLEDICRGYSVHQ